MNKTTACPLDCYDACEIILKNDKIKAKKEGHTSGFLCPHLNHYQDYDTIKHPRYNGVNISMEDALDKLKEILLERDNNKTLHYRNAGNFGLMQEVTEHFFASFGATLTNGSLCDSAGEAGIIQGRGSNKNMSLSEIQKSEVVIIWGRNPHATSSHLLPLLKNKTIIVIDPVKTEIAKMADVYLQIKPHSDIGLAMLLSRFLHIENGCDDEFLENYASESEEYYELTQTIRIKKTLDKMDITLGQIGDILSSVKNKKVSIICGVGIQKYRDGADIMRCIDAFAVNLGLFNKNGCGVAYLGNSKDGITSPFNLNAKRVSKVDTKFSEYNNVFIQGANPLSQMPNSLRVAMEMSQVKNIIYFGLHENETSAMAHLVIPAKSFLHKNDIRTSYSHNAMSVMNKVADTEFGISEYDLTSYLCKEFDIELKDEMDYIEHFKCFSQEKDNESLEVKSREPLPYKNGFDTDDNKFLFLEEFDSKNKDSKKMYLITSKSPKSLNSQFNRDEYIYINSSHGYEDDEMIMVTSNIGNIKSKVKANDDLRDDCVLIYSGTKGLNAITSSLHSHEGKCASFQEEKVEISRC